MTIQHSLKGFGSTGVGESSASPLVVQKSAWTDERVELAKIHREEGLSASQSAAILGVTRNAVIGKWGRMKLPPRRPEPPPTPRTNGAGIVTKIKSTQQQTRGRPRACDIITESALSPDEIPRQQRRTIATLGDRHCRFPYGNPGAPDFFFCGGMRQDAHIPIERGGLPYCNSHCRVAFLAGSKRKEWRDLDWRLETNKARSNMEGFSRNGWIGKGSLAKP